MPLHRRRLTDEQWAKLKPLPPSRGRPGHDARPFVNAVLFVAETDVTWRDLPERYGHWNSVWRRFSRCSAGGVPPGGGRRSPTPSASRTRRNCNRAAPRPARDPHAPAGERLPPPARRGKKDARARRCVGRSRGGLTTERRAACDGDGRPVRSALTAGRRHDAIGVPPLLAGLRPAVADRAYDGRPTRRRIAETGAAACVPPPKSRLRPFPDQEICKNGNRVERPDGRLKQYRKVAARSEKRPDTLPSLCRLAAVTVHL